MLDWLQSRIRLMAVMLVLLTAVAGGGLTAAIWTNSSALDQTRADLCREVDADHNRVRNDLIEGEQALYKFPEFKVLISSPQAEQFAYDLAKQKYTRVRETRPAYCDRYHRNPVPPFPSLQQFQDGTADGAGLP